MLMNEYQVAAFSVANLYYTHPILHVLAVDFNISEERASLVSDAASDWLCDWPALHRPCWRSCISPADDYLLDFCDIHDCKSKLLAGKESSD